MYGNLNVSGLVSPDATANPPPATTSTTATTRTHNQPQPHLLPFSTVTTAALQNNRDDPHLAGNEACMCSLCHIKDRFFPRSQDGRIVLPRPTTMSVHSHSTRLHRPTASMTNATPLPVATSALPTHRRNRTDSSTGYNRDLKFNEGRRGWTPQLQNDIAGGSFTETSANIGESHRSHATDESLHTPQMDEFEVRPFSGPSRRTQHKPKKKRPDPWPRIPDSEEFSVQSSHLSQQPSSSQHTSSRSRLESFLDRHGTAHPRNLLKTPQARELSLQTTNLEVPQPTTPVTTPQTPQTDIGAYGYEHHSIFSPHHQGTFDLRMSEKPGRKGTSHQHQHQHLRHHSASQPESLTDVAREYKKSSSRSKNPRSSVHKPWPTMSGERSVNSSPTRERPSTSYLPRLQFEESSSSSSFQTQFRFQEPLVPETHITSPYYARDSSTFNVKWDTDRKTKQGYFAQQKGAEKSPFRHYNKAKCDFDG